MEKIPTITLDDDEFLALEAAICDAESKHTNSVAPCSHVQEPHSQSLLFRSLLPFQKTAYNHAFKLSNGRFLLADEMGLGKTRTALAIMERLLNDQKGPLLILCPAALKLNWKNEIHHWIIQHNEDFQLYLVESAKKAQDSLTHLFPSRESTYDDKSPDKAEDLLVRHVRACDQESKDTENHEILPQHRKRRKHPWDSNLSTKRIKSETGKSFYLSEEQFRVKALRNRAKTIVLCCYELTMSIEKVLVRCEFPCIVADESHYIRNIEAARTQSTLKIAENASKILLLSGTPAFNRPLELYTQLHLIAPKYFSDMLKFESEFCRSSQGPTKLHQLLEDRGFMIRRLKSQVYKDLPRKNRQKIQIKVAASDHVQLKRYFDRLARLDEEKRAILQCRSSSESVGGAIDKIKQKIQSTYRSLHLLTGTTKLPGVMSFVKNKCQGDPKPKLIVFAHHRDVMDSLENFLVKSNISFIRIDGSTKQKVRQVQVNNFQSEPSLQVAVLSLTAAGTGLTLTAADCVVFAEITWNPGMLQQAEDRAHRIGRKKDVEIFYLIGEHGTLDEIMWSSVERKLVDVDAAIDGDIHLYQNNQMTEDQQSVKLKSLFEKKILEANTHIECIEGPDVWGEARKALNVMLYE